MADNHLLPANDGASLGLVGDRSHGRLDINLLRDGICRDGVSLSTAEQGRVLLSRLALVLDGLGWLPPYAARTVVDVVGDDSIGAAHSDDEEPAAAPPPEWLRRRVAEAAKALGVAADDVPILEHAPILWAEWEGHSHVALFRLSDGRLRWLVDGDIGGREPVAEMLRKRLVAYDEAAAATRRLLAVAERLGAETIWDSATHKGPQS